ncbi:MAG: calcium-binding protein, partial [Pseudomonadota bacterium]
MVKIGGEAHLIREISDTMISVYPGVGQTINPGERIDFLHGGAVSFEGNDAGLAWIESISSVRVGTALKAGSLYGMAVGKLHAEVVGVGMIVGNTQTGSGRKISVDSAYFENTQFNLIHTGGEAASVFIASAFGGPSLLEKMVRLSPLQADGERRDDILEGVTIVSDTIYSSTAQKSYGETAAVERLSNDADANRLFADRDNITIELTYEDAPNRLYGLNVVEVFLFGSGANDEPTGAVEIKVSEEDQASGRGISGGSLVIDDLEHPAHVIARFDRSTAKWDVTVNELSRDSSSQEIDDLQAQIGKITDILDANGLLTAIDPQVVNPETHSKINENTSVTPDQFKITDSKALKTPSDEAASNIFEEELITDDKTSDMQEDSSDPQFPPIGAEFEVLISGHGDRQWLDYRKSSSQISLNLSGEFAGEMESIILNSQKFDNVFGSVFDDYIFGGKGSNFVRAGSGEDSIFGSGGNDVIAGGIGADSIDGGNGDRDLLDYRASTEPVFADLEEMIVSGGDANGDSIRRVEGVIGTEFDDILIGSERADILKGEGGNDVISGNAGDDTISGGNRGDQLFGGEGNDWIDFRSSTEGVIVDLFSQEVFGGDGEGDLMVGFENVFGSLENDIISGGDGRSILRGMEGNDLLIATHSDVLFGGFGADTFIFNSEMANGFEQSGRIVVSDYSPGDEKDQIIFDFDLEEITYGSQLSGIENELLIRERGDNTLLIFDRDGDSSPELEIILKGISDFIL